MAFTHNANRRREEKRVRHHLMIKGWKSNSITPKIKWDLCALKSNRARYPDHKIVHRRARVHAQEI